jgi:DNA-binding MarR family transcriptional regulator
MTGVPTTAPPRLDPAELASRLRVSVWRAARRMRVESSVGISPTLHAALHSVEVHGPITPGQLAEHENVRKPTMTRTIASLLAVGLIERTPDPLDGRVSWLKVTPAGAKLLQRARQRQTEFLAARVKKLSDEDRQVLDRAAAVLDRLAGRDERASGPAR